MMGPEVKENSDWQGEKVRSSSLKEASVKQKLESAVKFESTRWRLLAEKSSSTSSSKRGSNVGKPWLVGIKEASKVLEGEKSPLSINLCSSSSPAHRVGRQGKTLLGTVRVRGSQTLASLMAERAVGDGEGDNDGHAELESR